MIFLADESVAGPTIERLRADGWIVHSIRETEPGIPDTEVLARANSMTAILLTEDKDFGELVCQQGASHLGVVLIRLSALPRDRRSDAVAEALCKHATDLAGAFSVVTPGGVRIRK